MDFARLLSAPISLPVEPGGWMFRGGLGDVLGRCWGEYLSCEDAGGIISHLFHIIIGKMRWRSGTSSHFPGLLYEINGRYCSQHLSRTSLNPPRNIQPPGSTGRLMGADKRRAKSSGYPSAPYKNIAHTSSPDRIWRWKLQNLSTYIFPDKFVKVLLDSIRLKIPPSVAVVKCTNQPPFKG